MAYQRVPERRSLVLGSCLRTGWEAEAESAVSLRPTRKQLSFDCRADYSRTFQAGLHL